MIADFMMKPHSWCMRRGLIYFEQILLKYGSTEQTTSKDTSSTDQDEVTVTPKPPSSE